MALLAALGFLERFGRAVHFGDAIMEIYTLVKLVVGYREYIFWFLLVMVLMQIYQFYMIRKIYTKDEK